MRTKNSAKVNQFKKLAENYCKGESYGVQDFLSATETTQFPWSRRCFARLWQYQVINVCIRISVVTKPPNYQIHQRYCWVRYTQYFSCIEKNTIILIGVQEQQLCQKTSTLFNDDKCMRKKILFQLTDSKKSAIYPQHCKSPVNP